MIPSLDPCPDCGRLAYLRVEPLLERHYAECAVCKARGPRVSPADVVGVCRAVGTYRDAELSRVRRHVADVWNRRARRLRFAAQVLTANTLTLADIDR